MLERSSGISNLTVTTPIVVANFFFKGILESKGLPSLRMDPKTTWQNGIFSSIVRLKRALNSSEDLPV